MGSRRFAILLHLAGRPIARVIGWGAAVGSLLSCSTRASESERREASLPTTPAGEALGAWLRIHNLGNLDSSRAFAARS